MRDLPMAVRGGDGSLRQFLSTGTQLSDEAGRRIGAVVAMRDVTADLRTRRVDAAQLDVATQLGDGHAVDPTQLVLDGLRAAFVTDDVAFVSGDDEVVDSVAAQGGTVFQRPLDEIRAELVAAVVVAGRTMGVVRVVGSRSELLDRQAATTMTSLVSMLSRHLERSHVRELSENLNRARAELERVIEQVEDFVFSAEIIDAHVVPVMSGRSSGVFGGEIALGELRGYFLDNVLPDDRREFEGWAVGVCAGRPAQMTCRITGLDGVVRWVWTRSKPRREGDRLWADSISTDVTDRQRLHLEREQLLRDRADQVHELEALDAAKSEFVATVAHEIRGPLGVLVTFADYAVDGMDGGEPSAAGLAAARRNVAMVARTAGHLQQVVENIFDLARYDAGALPPELAALGVDDLLGDAYQAASVQAGERGVKLVLDLAPGLEVLGDVTQLRQALDNIVGNAVKYTPSGGEVHISSEDAADGAVAIHVADTGIGIPPDALPHLFSRFFRAGNARTPETPGTGLGLALTRSIVEAHNGTLTIGPNPDVTTTGTLVTVLLPS